MCSRRISRAQEECILGENAEFGSSRGQAGLGARTRRQVCCGTHGKRFSSSRAKGFVIFEPVVHLYTQMEEGWRGLRVRCGDEQRYQLRRPPAGGGVGGVGDWQRVFQRTWKACVRRRWTQQTGACRREKQMCSGSVGCLCCC